MLIPLCASIFRREMRGRLNARPYIRGRKKEEEGKIQLTLVFPSPSVPSSVVFSPCANSTAPLHFNPTEERKRRQTFFRFSFCLLKNLAEYGGRKRDKAPLSPLGSWDPFFRRELSGQECAKNTSFSHSAFFT